MLKIFKNFKPTKNYPGVIRNAIRILETFIVGSTIANIAHKNENFQTFYNIKNSVNIASLN